MFLAELERHVFPNHFHEKDKTNERETPKLTFLSPANTPQKVFLLKFSLWFFLRRQLGRLTGPGQKFAFPRSTSMAKRFRVLLVGLAMPNPSRPKTFSSGGTPKKDGGFFSAYGSGPYFQVFFILHGSVLGQVRELR